MVGHGAIFIAPLLAGARHRLDGMGAIAPRAVHLEVAADGIEADEGRQCPLLRRLYLTTLLAQLRWHPGHAHGTEDVLLRLAAEPLTFLMVQLLSLPALRDAEDPVLVN